MREFLSELRRRYVFQVALTYLVVGWLLIQIVNNVAAPLNLPNWVPTVVIVFLAVGFPVALIVTWGFEATPKGRASVRREVGTSLAVLPFADMSPGADQEYFSDGITEELLNTLARVDELRVAGRTSSFHFKGRNEDLRTVSEMLGVTHVLEGSVRKADDKVRITAQLINGATGYHLWSATYDRALDDIFAIQEEIARSVVDALEVTLGVGELGRRAGMTRNAAAYDAYLQARAFLYDAWLSRNQIQALERAVRLDPSFAVAWATLAVAYRIRVFVDEPDKAEKWRASSDEALAKAREIAPEAAEVLAAAAQVAVDRGDWTHAERLYRRGLELHGNTVLALDFGLFLLNAGKVEDSIEYLAEARRIEPLWPNASVYLGFAYAASGRTQKAMAELDRGDRLQGPQASVRGGSLTTAMGAGDRAEVERRLDMILEIDELGMPINAAVRGLLDNPEAARAELRRLYDEPDNAIPVRRGVIAIDAAYFGDVELALVAWKESISQGGRLVNLMIAWQPVMREVRKLDGFKEFVREIGLVDYWRETGWGDFCRPVGQDDFECA